MSVLCYLLSFVDFALRYDDLMCVVCVSCFQRDEMAHRLDEITKQFEAFKQEATKKEGMRLHLGKEPHGGTERERRGGIEARMEGWNDG